MFKILPIKISLDGNTFHKKTLIFFRQNGLLTLAVFLENCQYQEQIAVMEKTAPFWIKTLLQIFEVIVLLFFQLNIYLQSYLHFRVTRLVFTQN